MKNKYTGEELRAELEKHDISVKELAEMLGLHYTSVYAWVKGKSTPTAENQKRMEELFGKKEDMTEKELKRNGSGYVDMTAYQAISNLDNEKEVYRGDIFYVKDNREREGCEMNGTRPALVVSNDMGNKHSDVISVVWLTTAEKKPMPTHCRIICKIPSTAICEQIVTVSKRRLGDFVKRATDAEMKEVDKCLMVALGLNAPCGEHDKQEVETLKLSLENERAYRLAVVNEYERTKADLEVTRKAYKDACLSNDKYLRKIEELENKPKLLEAREDTEAIMEKEIKRLKIKCELLEEQNEKLLEKLIG